MVASKVLVVDDDPDIRELLVQILCLFDFDSRCAQDGLEGLEVARHWRPQAIVLDLMLPDLNGFDVCEALRSEPATAGAGVLVLTSLHGHADRVRSFRVGADRFVTKPFNPDELVGELRSLIDETDESRRSGLRKRMEVDLSSAADLQLSVQRLLRDLLRSTPLSTGDVDRVGRAMLALGRTAVQRRREDANPRIEALACRVFADRMECVLEAKTADAANGAPFDHLSRLRANDSPEPAVALLGPEVEVCEPTRMTVTRRFAE